MPTYSLTWYKNPTYWDSSYLEKGVYKKKKTFSSLKNRYWKLPVYLYWYCMKTFHQTAVLYLSLCGKKYKTLAHNLVTQCQFSTIMISISVLIFISREKHYRYLALIFNP